MKNNILEGYMAKKAYKIFEQHILNIFKNISFIIWKQKKYNLNQLIIGRPKPLVKGECKTDLYIGLKDGSGNIVDEIKISLKLSNAEFLENKIKKQRAIDLFGPNWKNILSNNALSLSNNFFNKKLIYFYPANDPTEIRITLGWRIEIANKPRDLSLPLIMSNLDIINFIYRGINLPNDLKNCKVCGSVISDSGVANYYLQGDVTDFQSLSDIINKLQPLDQTFNATNTYLIFTANNYLLRANGKSKAETRSLCVYNDWELNNQNGRLKANITFINPLQYDSNDVKPQVLALLKSLNAETYRLFTDKFSKIV